MFKTILVPIDLSHREKGQPMIDVARNIGGEEAKIVLVSVIEDVPRFIAAQLPGGLLDKATERAADELKAMARAAGLKADCEVRSGGAHTGILEVAKARGVDLIVVGSHKPGLQDYLLGSTAARVVRHAKCAVLVAR
jgi:nucleotide-binding universal stress UspA family protein